MRCFAFETVRLAVVMNRTTYSIVLRHFETADPILYTAGSMITPVPDFVVSPNYFKALVDSIISQQLSIKVADVISDRVYALLPIKDLTPETILEVATEDLRAAGVSYAKIRSIKDLADKVSSQQLNLDTIDQVTNAEVIEKLTVVKGIGPWTAEMFLMFALARDDVFSVGDLGLRRAIQKLYKHDTPPSKEELRALSDKWAPYRTWAARILWQSLDLST